MKRTAMTRKTPLKATPPATTRVKPKRKCRVCGTVFQPFGIASWCSPDCGAELAMRKLAQQKEKEARAEKAKDRASLLDLKPLGYWADRAQFWFNRWIRLTALAAARVAYPAAQQPQASGMPAITRASAPALICASTRTTATCNVPGRAITTYPAML